MTTTLERSNATRPAFPADLREDLGDQILLRLALDAVQSLDSAEVNTAVRNKDNFRPQMMLTLLSYCYAARIYGSRQIEWASRNDRMIRYICAHTFPEWRAIRHFRRHNRELVERCLTYVLRKGWLLHAEEIPGEWMPSDWAGPDLDQKSASEARNRIEVAMIMDMSAAD